MSLPLGHAAVGIAVSELLPGKKRPVLNWKHYLFFALLANLPDIDVIFGLLFEGNGNLFHRGMTHSIVFSLAAAFLVSRAWNLWSKQDKTGFLACFFIIFSHIAADMLFTSSPVSLFWPFEIYQSSVHKGLLDIMATVLFETYRDTVIILFSALIFFLTRWLRHTSPLNLNQGKSNS